MPDFSNLLEFSHTHCIAICSVLVPLNLLATLQTMFFVWLERPTWVWRTASLAALFAGIMVLHVLTWFVVGVVAVQTFVLLALGSVCLSISLWAVVDAVSLRRVMSGVRQLVWRAA